ncbi:MAG: SDR family oxidoreductase [Paludibacteraceae bacterium]|nr:SDR family oxidoreductase [Paludibacteraceae bacterium]
MTLYSASKAAVEAAVRNLALELSGQQIRINSVIPGAVNTPMAKNVEENILNAIVAKQLLGMQVPEQIANLIVYLLSDRSDAITGRNIFVDGGMLGQ